MTSRTIIGSATVAILAAFSLWRLIPRLTLTECRGWDGRRVNGKAFHKNGIKMPIPPDPAKGYIGVGVSALWMIPGAMI